MMRLPENLKKVRLPYGQTWVYGWTDADLNLEDGFAYIWFAQDVAELLVSEGQAYVPGSELTGFELLEEMPVCENAYGLDGMEHVELYPLWMPLGIDWEEV